jgi:uncharacterized protein (TIGR02466 family)
MNENFQISVIRPFGPSIAKVTMPKELIDTLNQYIDKIVKDEKKSKKLDHGQKLAGNVKQEFILENDFVDKSGFLKFLGLSTTNWIKLSGLPKIKKFNLISAWVVRQFQDEYNPLHVHSGHISGVGYLKVPQNLGSTFQKTKKNNFNGTLDLIHGAKMFLSESNITIKPKVGDFYFFPHYLMHSVYPFTNTDEERRSVSFNATIDNEIFNAYCE